MIFHEQSGFSVNNLIKMLLYEEGSYQELMDKKGMFYELARRQIA